MKKNLTKICAELSAKITEFLNKISVYKVQGNFRPALNGIIFEFRFENNKWVSHHLSDQDILNSNIALLDHICSRLHRLILEDDLSLLKPQYQGVEKFRIESTSEEKALKFAEWCIENVRPWPYNFSPVKPKETLYDCREAHGVPLRIIYQVYLQEMAKTLSELPLTLNNTGQ